MRRSLLLMIFRVTCALRQSVYSAAGGTRQMQIRHCALWALLLGGAHHLAADVLFSVKDLGNLGGPFSTAQGHAINDLGQVTGDSLTTAGHLHAFLYSNDQMRPGNFGRF